MFALTTEYSMDLHNEKFTQKHVAELIKFLESLLRSTKNFKADFENFESLFYTSISFRIEEPLKFTLHVEEENDKIVNVKIIASYFKEFNIDLNGFNIRETSTKALVVPTSPLKDEQLPQKADLTNKESHTRVLVVKLYTML